ncbi:PI-PLC domain-containing protein [Membranihabitans marinus]|uniref:hypothetical protein n=1 Tax=Membranihabitans marinus TaxID=1227546 RepID=UPI001F432547|nr:hypothetical protein [Membranihabitans marinus]
MIRAIFFLLLLHSNSLIKGQNPVPHPFLQSILAHNDYQKSQPFLNAYAHGVGVIEVDLFYHDGEVLVAHDAAETVHNASFKKLYLKPLKKIMRARSGPYPNTSNRLALMFDIKNHREEIMGFIISLYNDNPHIFGPIEGQENLIPIIISGLRPNISTWGDLPPGIMIDGRLSDDIPPVLRHKVYMVSSSYSAVGNWDGKGECPDEEKAKLAATIQKVHDENLKIRFWGAKDVPEMWDLLMNYEVDILGVDHLDDFKQWLEK